MSLSRIVASFQKPHPLSRIHLARVGRYGMGVSPTLDAE
jgi:hypothetical protein